MPSGYVGMDVKTESGYVTFARSTLEQQTSRIANDGMTTPRFNTVHRAYDGQDADMKDNVGVAIPRHSSMHATTQQPVRGSIKANGHFACGTHVEISTDNSITKIDATKRDVVASNVSIGHGSYQFFGDSEEALDTFLNTCMLSKKHET
jgi:hypothetical protein